MFPSEMVVLMAMAATRRSVTGSTGCPKDVSYEHVAYLYNSLVRRGYLRETNPGGYQLTVKGRLAVLELLHHNEARVKELEKALQNLGIDTGEWTGKTGKKEVRRNRDGLSQLGIT